MRDFDIIVHGATGFVGRLTAARLVSAHPDLRVALSGRSADKLAEVQRAHASGAQIITADSLDASDMASLAARARVIISCVGPYSRLGAELVAACADAGTHYVDLCGEAPFIRRMIDEHQERATGTGARIVHSCGFDSVPSDMGAFALLAHAGEPLTRDTMVVEQLRGGLSGGTIDSMREVSAVAHRDREIARNLHNPYSLSPTPLDEPRIEGLEKDFRISRLDDGRWSGPFFMAMFNTRIVRRSNSLRGQRFVYRECWATGRGLIGRVKAYALAGVTAALFAVAQKPFFQRFIPQPGDGPSEKQRAKGHFRFTHHGVGESGREYSCTVAAQGDPGYDVTAMMLSEAAVTLLDHTALPRTAGILTPATGLGSAYLARLRAGGMSFTCA